MTVSFILTDGAADDLRSIVRYTRKTWGETQARTYAEILRNGIQRLVNGEGKFKILDDIHPSLRAVRCEHHYIFCLRREDAPSLIVAILHERMDLVARITDRLD